MIQLNDDLQLDLSDYLFNNYRFDWYKLITVNKNFQPFALYTLRKYRRIVLKEEFSHSYTWYEKADIMTNAAKYGDLDFLKLLGKPIEGLKSTLVKHAIFYGHLDVLKYIINNYYSYNTLDEIIKLRKIAIENNRPDMVKYLEQFEYDSNIGRIYQSGELLWMAIRSNNLNLVKKYYNDFDIDYKNGLIFKSAIRLGNIKIIDYLLKKHKHESYNKILLTQAIKSDKVNVVRLLVKYGAVLTSSYLDYALNTKNIKMVEFILSQGIEPTVGTVRIIENDKDQTHWIF